MLHHNEHDYFHLYTLMIPSSKIFALKQGSILLQISFYLLKHSTKGIYIKRKSPNILKLKAFSIITKLIPCFLSDDKIL